MSRRRTAATERSHRDVRHVHGHPGSIQIEIVVIVLTSRVEEMLYAHALFPERQLGAVAAAPAARIDDGADRR
jgi:hypothetical protein